MVAWLTRSSYTASDAYLGERAPARGAALSNDDAFAKQTTTGLSRGM